MLKSANEWKLYHKFLNPYREKLESSKTPVPLPDPLPAPAAVDDQPATLAQAVAPTAPTATSGILLNEPKMKVYEYVQKNKSALLGKVNMDELGKCEKELNVAVTPAMWKGALLSAAIKIGDRIRGTKQRFIVQSVSSEPRQKKRKVVTMEVGAQQLNSK